MTPDRRGPREGRLARGNEWYGELSRQENPPSCACQNTGIDGYVSNLSTVTFRLRDLIRFSTDLMEARVGAGHEL